MGPIVTGCQKAAKRGEKSATTADAFAYQHAKRIAQRVVGEQMPRKVLDLGQVGGAARPLEWVWLRHVKNEAQPMP